MAVEKPWQAAAAFAFEFGATLALALLFFIWLGRKLDAIVGTEPLFSILGILLGLTASAIWTYRKIQAIKP